MPGLGAAHDMGAVLVAGRRGSGAHTHFVAVIPVDPGADAALVGGDENVVARIDSIPRDTPAPSRLFCNYGCKGLCAYIHML